MPEITTAGIIRHDSLFLVAKRKEGGSMSGRWAFPGGKADADETPRDALRREIREEFGAAARVGRHLERGGPGSQSVVWSDPGSGRGPSTKRRGPWW